MNILITDYYCASNRGDAAIFEGVHQALTEVYPDAEIFLMTEYPEAAKLIHGIEAFKRPLSKFKWNLSKSNFVRFYLLINSFLYRNEVDIPFLRKIKSEIDIEPYFEADLVVSTGGHYLTDIYFPNKISVLWEIYFLKKLNKPVVIYGQTLGPFLESPYQNIIKHVLNNIDLIITRDKKSKKNLENLKVKTPTYFTADPAFSIDKEMNKFVPINHFGDIDGLAKDGNLTVSISVREWKHMESDKNIEDYINSIAKLTDWLVGEKNANVIFASTCTSLAGYHKDDRLCAIKIIEKMKRDYQKNVNILSGEYTPQELIKIYEQMDIHLGMRMHSNILAMLAETPVIAIEYQFKTTGLMEQFDILDYMINIDKVNFESLKHLVEKGLKNRTTLKKKIQARLPSIKKESKRSAQLIKDNINVKD